MKSSKILIIFAIILSFITLPSHAEQADLKYFTSGSYQQLLKEYADKPFVLMVWSIHCTTCLQKMPLLNELSKNIPGVNLVMLATDDASVSDQVKSILAGNELNKLEIGSLLMSTLRS